MYKLKQNTLFCFSPPVMTATFIIELVLLVLVVLRYKLNTTTRLIAAALFCLAFFQLCEYFVCGGLGVNANVWSRLGFVAITTLPPIGLHIIYSIARQKQKYLVWASYAVMSVWIALFMFSSSAMQNYECSGNYVIFDLQHTLGYFYTTYYYFTLLLGMVVAHHFAAKTTKTKNGRRQKQALLAMILGYLVFLVPTAVVNTLKPETIAGIPSIMCGFAVLFAFILYFYIIPRVSEPKNKLATMLK